MAILDSATGPGVVTGRGYGDQATSGGSSLYITGVTILGSSVDVTSPPMITQAYLLAVARRHGPWRPEPGDAPWPRL